MSDKQLIEMIAQGQAQRIAQDRQQQQIMAAYDQWKQQQQIMSEFDAWKASQPQAHPVQAQPVQTAPKRDLQAEAQEYFAKVREERRNEAKAQNQPQTQTRIPSLVDTVAKRITNNILPKGVEDILSTTQKVDNSQQNESIENKIFNSDRYIPENIPQLTDDQKALEEQILNADRYVPDNANKEKWNERFLTAQEKSDAITNTTQEDVNRWLLPQTKLTQKEKGIARAYAAAELAKIPTNASTHQPIVQTDAERQHYRDMVEIMNKTNPISSAMSGYMELPFNLVDMAGDAGRKAIEKAGNISTKATDALGITEGANQTLNEKITAANEVADAKEANQRQSFANAQTQYPLANAGGKIAGQITMYALTNPVFDGIAEGAGVTNELAKFFINQGAQNAQDLALDTAPLIKQLMADGSMSDEDKREVFNNVLLNALGNATIGTLQEIPNIAKYAGGKIDARRAADEAFRQNVRAGADKLAKLAGTEDVDNVVRNAIRQTEEATQNIDNIAKQMPEAGDLAKAMDAEGTGAVKYNPDYKGVPVEYNEKFVEPEALVHKLTGKKVSPEYAAAVRKLESGESITSEEYNAIPEIIDAKKRAGSSADQTINDKSLERVKKREMWLNQLYDNSGSAVRTTVDGKTKTVYNGSVRRDKRADIILGLPSSGKSSAIVDPISYKYKSRLIDSDEAKKLIDEFDDGWGAGRVHVESGEIADRLLARAILDGDNVVIPKVGKNYDSMAEVIDSLKANGYSVNLHFNELDPNKAAGRNMRRFANDGRFLDLDATSFSYGNKPSEVFERLVKEGKADGYTRVSNDVRMGENPVQLKGTEDISFNWGDNRPGGSEYSKELGEVYRGGTPETGAVSDTTPLNGGNDYGTDNAAIQPGAGRNIDGAESSNLQGPGRMDEGTGEVGRGDNRVLRQSTVNDVTPELRQRMDSANIRNVGLKPSTDVNKFSAALDEARKYENNTHGVFVSPKTPEKIQEIIDNGGKALISDDGTSGVIVTADGDIEGVFYNKGLAKQLGLPTRGAFDDLMLTAIANGGKKLDCYGDGLGHMYARMGMEPVVASKYIPGKEWSAEMDAWKATEAARKGVNVDDINTDVYVFKLRDGWTVDDVMDAMQTGSLKEYADNLDLSLEAVNKNVPKSVFEVPEDDIYDSTLKYRDSLMKQPETGAFSNGVNPDDLMKERGTSRHIRNDGTPMKMEGVSDEVVADFKDNPDMYKVLRNSDTIAKAEKVFNESADPLVDFRDMVRKHDPAALPLGHQLAKDYSAAGNHDAAAQIYREMGEQLTKAGQFSQAAAINMMKNDPLTALAYFERELDALNKAGADKYGKKWKDFILTDQEKALFDNINPGDTDAIKSAIDQIGQRIEKEYPSSVWEKVLEFRRVAMLFNTRTIARNTLANPPTALLRYFSDRIEGVGQWAAHLIKPEFEVTQAVRGSNLKTRKLATQIFDSDKVKAMFEGGSGRISEIPKVGDYAKSKQMFKGGVVSDWINRMTDGGVEKLNEKLGKKGAKSVLELTRNATYKALEVTDNPMVRENFISRLGSYIRARDIKNIDDVPDEAIQLAYEEAMKATYKDESFMVDAIRKFKGAIERTGNHIAPGLGDMASQALIPYVQAPGNIAARTIDYSAIGLGKGINKIIKGANSGDLKLLSKGIEEASKGTTGTLSAILGYALYKSGILTGTYSTDKDQKAFEKQHGFREFALRYKVKGQTKYDTIDWMQPFVDTIMPGVLLAQAIENSDEYDSDILKYFGHEGTLPGKVIGVAKESAKKNVNYYFDSTPLKNLGELFKSNYSGESDIAGNLWQNTVEDFAGALVPAGLNAVAKSVDPVQRQITDPSNSFGTFVNSIGAKIPGLSKELPAKYDTWGQPMTYGNSKGEAAFAKMLYPGEHTSDKSDEIDTEISRLFDTTGNKAVFPIVAPNKVGDKKLNAKEVSSYQEDVGKRNRALVENFVNSDSYKDLEDKNKAETISNLYGASKAITEREVFGKEVAEKSSYKAAIKAYDDAGGGEEGIKAMVNYYNAKSVSDSAGVRSNSNAAKDIQKQVEEGNMDAANEMAEQVNLLPSYGLDSPASQGTYTKAYNVYGEGYSAEEFAKTFKSIDKDGNQTLKKYDEIIPYMNSHYRNDYKEGMKFWKAFANKDWDLPKLENNTWK